MLNQTMAIIDPRFQMPTDTLEVAQLFGFLLRAGIVLVVDEFQCLNKILSLLQFLQVMCKGIKIEISSSVFLA
jgi:hypothetical protein